MQLKADGLLMVMMKEAKEERLEKRWKTELEKEDQWVRLRKNRARRTGTGEGPARY